VSEINKAGKHLLELINEVLDLAKIETGRLSISLEPVQLFGVMDEVLTLMKPMAEKHGIEIERCAPSVRMIS
jgi:signal transduction histidine kinase